MLVSHEVPLSLLEKSRSFNDYDYALVHLFEIYPAYKQFYIDSLKKRRIVYLDNSLFELGTLYDHDKFAKEATELGSINPSNFYYIVPDALGDTNATIQSFKDFSKFSIPGKKIGVVQGNTLEELTDCFKFMKENADMVAICFSGDYFYEYEGDTKEAKLTQARIDFIKHLDKLNLLKDSKIHLLGCQVPQEFKNYKNIPEIVSLDTSNPIVHGIYNVRYSKDGLRTKIRTKLVDLMDYKGSINAILLNIWDFRNINGL
ncbi:hypothetical protein ACXG0S_001928 [Campylobacter coli]